MKILYIDLTRLFWVYTIILISNIGNLHVYSERTIIRNTRVGRYEKMSCSRMQPILAIDRRRLFREGLFIQRKDKKFKKCIEKSLAFCKISKKKNNIWQYFSFTENVILSKFCKVPFKNCKKIFTYTISFDT